MLTQKKKKKKGRKKKSGGTQGKSCILITCELTPSYVDSLFSPFALQHEHTHIYTDKHTCAHGHVQLHGGEDVCLEDHLSEPD